MLRLQPLESAVSDVLRLSDATGEEGRFSRFERIDWWDQQRLADAKVLVLGAGALGNELIKNLALVGIGSVMIADLDRVENSNLSRSVLFRESDCGRAKAEVAAEYSRTIYPDQRVQSWQGNIVYDLGLGVYRWADIILGGLDNREARVAINQAAAKLGKPWIDGAIERLDGVARVFDPSTGPCYECTMSPTDWDLLAARRSCALLTRAEMEQGKVPTTPTTASIIAGMQVQEALKILHGMQALSGQGFVFEGLTHQSYLVRYTRLQDCPTHDSYQDIQSLPGKVSETRVGDFLDRVVTDLGPQAVIETNHDLLASLTCPHCQKKQRHLASLGKVSEAVAQCPHCGTARTPDLYHTIRSAAGSSTAGFLDMTLGDLGIPDWDILTGRAGMEERYYEFTGDQADCLGPLFSSEHKL